MKFFETNGKYNWVDKNNVFVGFDSYQCCCEEFGYLITKTIPSSINDDDDNIDLEDYTFDTKFYKDIEFHFECLASVFRMVNSKGEKAFLTLYNSHNGYYSHGFEMKLNEEKLYWGNL